MLRPSTFAHDRPFQRGLHTEALLRKASCKHLYRVHTLTGHVIAVYKMDIDLLHSICFDMPVAHFFSIIAAATAGENWCTGDARHRNRVSRLNDPELELRLERGDKNARLTGCITGTWGAEAYKSS